MNKLEIDQMTTIEGGGEFGCLLAVIGTVALFGSGVGLGWRYVCKTKAAEVDLLGAEPVLELFGRDNELEHFAVETAVVLNVLHGEEE